MLVLLMIKRCSQFHILYYFFFLIFFVLIYDGLFSNSFLKYKERCYYELYKTNLDDLAGMLVYQNTSKIIVLLGI